MDFSLTPAQCELQARARALAAGPVRERAAAVDRDESYPWDTVADLTAAGFMGMTLPTTLGGQGASLLDAVLVVEAMAAHCGITGRIVVEANMGAVGAVMAWGSDAQRTLAADLVLAGDKPAICITEPEAGSDATAMTTTAVRDGNHWVLNGTKHWITGGGVSRLHLVFARMLDGEETLGIGGFLAIRDEDNGLVIGRREHAMGLRGIPETEVHCRDLRLPDSRRLDTPGGPARGFARLMSAYNAQRVGAATVALGIAQGAHDLAIQRVKERHQFGRPLAEFQGLQWLLADAHIALSAARLLIQRAAASAAHHPSGFPDPLLAAEAKVFAADTAMRVANDALQLHGAPGYGRSLPLERMARDARMFSIGGGTAQMLRNLVAGRILEMKLPQTRDGWADSGHQPENTDTPATPQGPA